PSRAADRPSDPGARRDRVRRSSPADERDHVAGRTVRRIHRLLRLAGAASAGHGRERGPSSRRSDSIVIAADEAAALSFRAAVPPRLPFRAATIWQNLEAAGVNDVVGAWQHVSQLMTVVALKQRYDGHAKRAALVAAAHSYMARLVVVVDDDIDPSNLNDVMW